MTCHNLSVSPEGRLLFAGRDTGDIAAKYGTALYLIKDDMRYNALLVGSERQHIYFVLVEKFLIRARRCRALGRKHRYSRSSHAFAIFCGLTDNVEDGDADLVADTVVKIMSGVAGDRDDLGACALKSECLLDHSAGRIVARLPENEGRAVGGVCP